MIFFLIAIKIVIILKINNNCFSNPINYHDAPAVINQNSIDSVEIKSNISNNEKIK